MPHKEKQQIEFGAVMHGMAGAQLEQVFNSEYLALDAHLQHLIRQDFLESNLSANKYRQNIGAGNLASYAAVMGVRERQGWSSAVEAPKIYLSTSGGKYRVINQGLPLSVDKPTAAEALAVAAIYKMEVSPQMWNGDTGTWGSREPT